MNNAWNWTVFQLMTQSAIQEQDETNKQLVTDFVGNLLNNDSITRFKLHVMYK